LTTTDLWKLGILTGITLILIFTLVPLLTYLLISVAKSVFDLSAGWLTAFVAVGAGVFYGLSNLIGSVMPPLIQLPAGWPPLVQRPADISIYNVNFLIPVLLLAANVLIFWSGTKVIDRKLNI